MIAYQMVIDLINERFAILEKRIDDLAQRTAHLEVYGPKPEPLGGEIERLLDEVRKFPKAVELSPEINEAMPEEFRKDNPPTSITDDPNDPRIRRGGGPDTQPVPQNDAYLVLPASERAKGFVRPYRDSYKHVGKPPKYPTRPLTEEEERRHGGNGYVVYEEYPESESPMVGRFWTQAQLDAKGCGTVTTMGRELSETYARDPHFYGFTYCCGCMKHLPVEEFVWTLDGDRVGS